MTDDLYVYLDQIFEWDRMKAARNAIEYGVRFPEAASVFFDEKAISIQIPITHWKRVVILCLVTRLG